MINIPALVLVVSIFTGGVLTGKFWGSKSKEENDWALCGIVFLMMGILASTMFAKVLWPRH